MMLGFAAVTCWERFFLPAGFCGGFEKAFTGSIALFTANDICLRDGPYRSDGDDMSTFGKIVGILGLIQFGGRHWAAPDDGVSDPAPELVWQSRN